MASESPTIRELMANIPFVDTNLTDESANSWLVRDSQGINGHDSQHKKVKKVEWPCG